MNTAKANSKTMAVSTGVDRLDGILDGGRSHPGSANHTGVDADASINRTMLRSRWLATPDAMWLSATSGPMHRNNFGAAGSDVLSCRRVLCCCG
jgi:hypothetical protein